MLNVISIPQSSANIGSSIQRVPRQCAAGAMSFPVLQVASLAGDPPLDEATGPGDVLPPVASNTPVRSAVYSIGESSKRSRSAGRVYLCILLTNTYESDEKATCVKRKRH